MNASLANGQWTSQHVLVGAGVPMDQCHPHPQRQQTLQFNGKTPGEPDGGGGDLLHHRRQAHLLLQHPHYLQQQQQQQQARLADRGQQPPQCQAKHTGANLNGVCGVPNTERTAGYSHPGEAGNRTTHNPPCLSNGHLPAEPATHAHTTVGDACMDYSMADMPLAQVLSSLSQCPPPNVALEQILGVGGPAYRQIPTLEPYGMVTSEIPHDPNHSKVENGCILNGTYPGRGCSLPNVNGAPPPNVQLPCPDSLSSLPGLPDAQATGFYL